ncbi:MAG: hypothetical protein EBS51_06620, partial [Planctomycetia bacterium]|nr:hypothetical protein [Planctomycetia bacterium]
MRAIALARFVAATLPLVLAASAVADPWIDSGVKPRLLGRGTTGEIVVTPWHHEALDVVFYPPATFAPWTGPDAASAAAAGSGSEVHAANVAARVAIRAFRP